MEFFKYEEGLQILTCRECKTGVIGSRILSHLQGEPHNLQLCDIRSAQEWASKLKIAHTTQDIDAIPVPSEYGPGIDGLGDAITGGFRCELEPNCAFVGANPRRMFEHFRKDHGWEPKTKTGRHRKGYAAHTSMPWRAGVSYQRLFASGERSNYFEVKREHKQGDSTTTNNTEEHGIKIDEAVCAFRSKTAGVRQQEVDKIGDQADFGLPNTWLRRLGAARHLKEFSNKKDFLIRLISTDCGSVSATPEPKAHDAHVDSSEDSEDDAFCDDDHLVHVYASIRRIVRQGRAVARSEVVSWNALFEVNKVDRNKERSRPFHFRHVKDTRKRYVQVCMQLFSYIVRCMSIEDEKRRPPFRLSRRQTCAYERMMAVTNQLVNVDDSVEAQEMGNGDCRANLASYNPIYAKLDDAVMEVYLSVVDHFTKDTEYDSILVSFIMVLSVRADKTWETFVGLTPKLSAIMAISRLFIVKYAVDTRSKSIDRKMQNGFDRQAAEQESPSHFDIIQELVNRFMVSGNNSQGWSTTPMQFIVRLRNYGMAAAQAEARRGTVSWDGEDAIHKGIRLNIVGLQKAIQAAQDEAEKILFKELLFFTKFSESIDDLVHLPVIPWHLLEDNAADATIGYSFVNRLIELEESSSDWIWSKLKTVPAQRGAWFKASDSAHGSIRLCSTKAAQYGAAIERFLMALLFLVHISYGQPARGPELLTVQHRNTANGGVRNIFIDSGLVMIVTRYHKGFNHTEREKIIHRFLPREIGTLLVYYLWLVLPFWEELEVNVFDKRELSPTIWATEGMLANDTGDTDSDNDGYEEQHKSRVSSSERHPTTGTAQGSKTAPKYGSGPHWTSPRMSRILKRKSLVGCQQGFNISGWRHLSAAISRRYFRTSTTAHAVFMEQVEDNRDSDSDGGGEDSSPWDMQAGHTSMTGGLVYGRLMTEGSFETNIRRVDCRFISEEWHRLLGFPSALSGFGEVLRPGRKRKNPSLHYEALQHLQLMRWKTLRRVNIDRELARLYGDGTTFRGRQRDAVSAVMMNKSPVVVVMGTGTGKSLCFMLPAASCAGGISIVVVPLVSLLGDMLARCERIGIPCAEWRTNQRPGNVSIVFVTPESALTKRFLDYIESLRIVARLDRIVVDEGHTILEGTPKFRPRLREMGRLALIGIQMVYLTATLPVTKEQELYELIHTRPEDVVMIRAPTTRKNIAYSVIRVHADNGEEAAEAMTATVIATVTSKLREYAWPAKIIIYVQRVAAAEHLADKFGCDAYFRDVDTRDGKAARLQAWQAGLARDQLGEGRVIVATNALGLGLDIPDIRAVIHVDMPRSIADFAQQSGRAGRDGRRSESIVLSMNIGGQQWRSKVLRPDNGSVEDYLGGHACRRVVLDFAMDGREDRKQCEEGEEQCDVCIGRNMAEASESTEDEDEQEMRWRAMAVERSRRQLVDRTAEEQASFSRLHTYLDVWSSRGCIACYSQRHDGRDHVLSECPTMPLLNERQDIAWSKTLRMENYMRRPGILEDFSSCHGCLAPQELCNLWEEDAEIGGWHKVEGGECQYEGVLSAVVSYIHHGLEEEAKAIYSRLGFVGTNDEEDAYGPELWRWFGKRVEWADRSASNICLVFAAMMEEEEPEEQ